MKIRVTFKDPDALIESLDIAYRAEINSLMTNNALTREEAEVVAEKRRDDMHEYAKKFFEYGEYLTVEIDDKAKTIVVLGGEDL